MKTLGFLVDQLSIVNLKMWNAQELLYKVRRMSYKEFLAFYSKEENLKELYETFKKACDLNIQRNNVIEDIDGVLLELVEAIQTKSVDLSKLTLKQYKTY
mgnify:FL=1